MKRSSALLTAFSRPSVTTSTLILGSLVAGWLRFDLHWVLLGYAVMVVCFAAAVAGWLRHAATVPRTPLPPEIQELMRDRLTEEEEARFADALRARHREDQRAAWEQIARGGPAPRVVARTSFYYLWLSVIGLGFIPPAIVSPVIMPRVPRFLVVLLPLALLSFCVAAPLGIRDFTLAKKGLSEMEKNGAAGSAGTSRA